MILSCTYIACCKMFVDPVSDKNKCARVTDIKAHALAALLLKLSL